jgi:hypothetical protein
VAFLFVRRVRLERTTARQNADVDQGLPTVASDPTGPLTAAYTSLAHNVAAELWQLNQITPVSTEIVMLEE